MGNAVILKNGPQMFQSEPCLQFRSNSIIGYNLPIYDNVFRHQQKFLSANLRLQKTYTGVLTNGAKKRLIRAVELLIQATPQRFIENEVTGKIQPFKMNFFTLTFAEKRRVIPASEAHETCLEPFLRWMRQKWGCHLYIWKAEHQKRGQLHYHITTGTFVHWKEVRAKWNELQREAGYLDGFYMEKGHYDPNSTDVHSLRKIKNLSAYFLKEIGKTYQSDKDIGGKVWDCSMQLKQGKYFVTIQDYEYTDRINEHIRLGNIKPVYADNCTIYKFFQDITPDIVMSKGDLIRYNSIMKSLQDKQAEPVPKLKAVKADYWKAPDENAPRKVNFVVSPTLFSTS